MGFLELLLTKKGMLLAGGGALTVAAAASTPFIVKEIQWKSVTALNKGNTVPVEMEEFINLIEDIENNWSSLNGRLFVKKDSEIYKAFAPVNTLVAQVKVAIKKMKTDLENSKSSDRERFINDFKLFLGNYKEQFTKFNETLKVLVSSGTNGLRSQAN